MSIESVAFIAFTGTARPELAKKFYRDSLGFRQIEESAQDLVFDTGRTMLRITILENFAPQPFTVLGWAVADLEREMDRLTANGIIFEVFKGLSQDARGVCTFPSGDRVAWFRDPDGSMLSLTQFAQDKEEE